MTVLTVNSVTRAGLNLTATLTAAGNSGDSWAGTGQEILAVANGSESSITVTLAYQRTFDGATPSNKTVSVAAGKTLLIGPFPQILYNDTNQRVNVTYSSASSVTVAVFRLG